MKNYKRIITKIIIQTSIAHTAGKNKGRFVTITKTYTEIPEDKVNVTVRIFDHFGLDVDDILKFGTANLVREKLPYLVQFALEAGNMYAGAAMGSVDEYFETSAKGFRAWFILQHCRGYRPFVTVMEKPIVWEGVL